ncbi:hypothetical protein B0T18DRAFT_115048 [Schizothecium vesticola]|uniref:Uncharacterized protein n=1 Tax=Schizothecium vesticola TaxID=314040 RepID=A0AA40F206_9PEZI|nr:hypothetical protein B0T18DRAFT_115048 [Schizothecium vesticola]
MRVLGPADENLGSPVLVLGVPFNSVLLAGVERGGVLGERLDRGGSRLVRQGCCAGELRVGESLSQADDLVVEDVIVRAEAVAIDVERSVGLVERLAGVEDLADGAVHDAEELSCGRGSGSGVIIHQDCLHQGLEVAFGLVLDLGLLEEPCGRGRHHCGVDTGLIAVLTRGNLDRGEERGSLPVACLLSVEVAVGGARGFAIVASRREGLFAGGLLRQSGNGESRACALSRRGVEDRESRA